MTTDLRRFILGQPVAESIAREQKITTLNQDYSCDFLPENCIPGDAQTINAAFRVIESRAATQRAESRPSPMMAVARTAAFSLEPFINGEVPDPLQTLKEYSEGSVPVVSAAATDNGVAAWLDIPEHLCLENCITISLLHNTKPCEAFWHPHKFSALVGKALVPAQQTKCLRNLLPSYIYAERLLRTMLGGVITPARRICMS